MRRIRTTFTGVLILVMALGVFTDSITNAQDPGDVIVVIVHPQNGVDELSRTEVRSIFLKEDRTWNDGSEITPYQYPTSEDLRAAFAEEVLRMSPREENAHWADLRLRQGILPPRTRSSTRLVRMFVARQRTAIGYIPEDELEDGVKEVFRFTVPREDD